MFAEDDGHRALLTALISRVALEEKLTVQIEVRSAEGGSGRALQTLRQYGADLSKGLDSFLEVLVVAIDGNCASGLRRRQQIDAVLRDRYPGRLVCAVPDPHVELWYLADRRALPQVLEADFPVEVPTRKCERGRYKDALRQACRQGGVEPVADGVEYGEEIAKLMDLDDARRNDDALGTFLNDLRGALRLAGTSS